MERAQQFTAIGQTLMPSQWQVLGRGADSASGGGAFLGYNTQWQDLILGVEANYTHTNLSVTAPFFQIGGRVDTDGDVVKINSASAHLGLTDYAEARGRAGYIVGNLLPYGFVGFVAGLGDYNVSVSAQCTATSLTSLMPRFHLILKQRWAKQCAALGLLRRCRTGLGADPEFLSARRVRVHSVHADRKHKRACRQRPTRRRVQVLSHATPRLQVSRRRRPSPGRRS